MMKCLSRTNSINPVYMMLVLLLVWIAASGILVYRLDKLGAFTSVGSRKILKYVKNYAQANPASVRLNQSYSQWALALNGTDASNYIKAGLGFAERKGVSIKEISPEHPDAKTYFPYYYQSPGAPIVIGIMIKLFGERQILPYYLLILAIHFISALLTCVLASRFVTGSGYILGAGLLSLLCIPALTFNFGLGLFCGEPLAAFFIVTALISLSFFWTKLEQDSPSFKYICLTAFGFGASLALSAYCRDIYTTFAQFCFLALLLAGLIKRNKFKQILVFIVISGIVFSAIELPWEKRNQHYFGEFTMTGSTYCGYALWHFIWDDYKKSKLWASNSGHGLGNYLAPEKSTEVLAKLDQDKKTGSLYAAHCLIEAVTKKPWDALQFKASAYRTLWLGGRKHWQIYGWCIISIITFFVFLGLTRFRFTPALWLFPLFLLCLSPIIHYEHRYSQPFFLFITPVTAMYVLRYLIIKFRRLFTASVP